LTDPPARAPRRRLRLILAGIGLAVLAAVVIAYAARRAIVREALAGWLRERGVASQVQVERFGLSGFTGRVQVGDPARPDFAAERVVVGYRLTPALAVEVTSVRLEAPVLRARLHAGRLSFGALDPIIAEFARKPAPLHEPAIRIDHATVLLATDYGPLRLGADARLEDGRLVILDATSAPARLQGGGAVAGLGAGALHLKTTGAQLSAALDLAVPQAVGGGATLSGGRLLLNALLPYPDLKQRRDGVVSLRANLAATALTAAGGKLTAVQFAAGFDGRAAGGIETLVVAGAGTVGLRAAGADLGAAKAELLRVDARSGDLRWSRAGGDAVGGQVVLQGGLGRLDAGALGFSHLIGDFQGPVAWGAKGASAQLAGSVAGRGGYSGLGAPLRTDGREVAAVKRAVRSFRVSAPGVRVAAQGHGWSLGLPQPLRLAADAGGEAVVSARGGATVFGPAGGAMAVKLSGPGLPAVAADITRLQLTPDGMAATGRVRAAGSFGMVQDGAADVTGDLRITGGDWRLQGRAQGVGGSVAAAQVRLEGAAGRIEASRRQGALAGRLVLTTGRVRDAAPQARFSPLTLGGVATLARQALRGDLTVADPAGRGLARASLRHDLQSGRGGVDIDTGTLAFSPGGLQPAQLSPLAAAIGSPAQGQARFAGRFDWTAQGAASHGELSVPGLDFKSPAGAVTGLSGDIVFTSLAPLTAAPGQVLHARGLAAIAPLSDITASFAVDDKALTITGGQALVAGGKVRIETLEVPLTAGAPVRGVLGFEGVQLHDLVEASPFGDKVDLRARVSGRVPFDLLAGKVHVQGGQLTAIEPGRLSIDRSALQAVPDTSAGAATAAAGANATISDFAYQAMENLAFETLDAKIDSLPAGRLGVLFHIVGRHDPPTKQQIRLSLSDLISRRFLGRPLPLPSGTQVNLTLDTTLNLDDLLADFAAYQRLRGSAGVQP
jgi:hypothetical protein